MAKAKTEIANYKKEIAEATKHIKSADNSQTAKNAHIEKLTEKLNHSIQCIKDNWHHDITKADFVDLSVSTRLVLEDKIWCLIRWRHKLPDIPAPTPQQQQQPKPQQESKNNDDDDTNTKSNKDTSNPNASSSQASSSSTTPNTKKKKYNDEYFWTSQTTYLKKVSYALSHKFAMRLIINYWSLCHVFLWKNIPITIQELNE